MLRYRPFLLVLALCVLGVAHAQTATDAVRGKALERLLQQGFAAEDLGDLVVKDDYVSTPSGVRHTYLRQRWQGIEVWNGDIAVHSGADSELLQLNVGAWPQLAKRVNTTNAVLGAEAALTAVLARTAPGVPTPAQIATADNGRKLTFDGSALGDEPVHVQLVYVPVADRLRLAWNVNHYTPDGSHWWNVRILSLIHI